MPLLCATVPSPLKTTMAKTAIMVIQFPILLTDSEKPMVNKDRLFRILAFIVYLLNIIRSQITTYYILHIPDPFVKR